MSVNGNSQDPLAFIKGMWSSMGVTLPGMMVPTMDPDELDKRIKDLRAVEGWLRMNLNMLSASINTLEVQRATLATLKAFGQSVKPGEAPEPSANPFVTPTMWPWNLIQQAAAQAVAPAADKPEDAGR